MTVRVNKPAFNIREKLSELERPIGLKGSELMKSETVQEARDFISAGRKNILINGDFRIAQRGTSSNSMAGNVYATVDRFFSYTANTNGTVTQTQDDDTPFGIGYSFKFESSNTGSPTNTSYYGIQQRVEGNHCADAIVYGSTVSFWVKSNKSGLFPIAVFQNDSNNVTTRYSTQAYVNGNGTWQYITKYIPPGPAANNPRNDNAASYYLDISMQAGSAYAFTSGQLNNWVQSGSVAGPNFGLCESNGNYIQFAMIQVEVGKNATEFEHRSYGEELALCQRYCQSFDGRIAIGNWNGPTGALVVRYLNPPMRIAPSIHSYTAGRCLVEAVAWYNVGSVSIQSETTNTSVVFTLSSVANSGQSVNANAMWGNGASVVLQAEL